MSTQKRDSTVLAILLLLLGFSLAFDIVDDLNSGAKLAHLTWEIFLVITILVGAVFALRLRHQLRREISSLNSDLTKVQQLYETERKLVAEGLLSALQKKFEEWGFTAAEKEVATLLLKGLSLKEIAELRHTSERTVRQQAQSVYSKSNLAGRAELSAYFIEDLL